MRGLNELENLDEIQEKKVEEKDVSIKELKDTLDNIYTLLDKLTLTINEKDEVKEEVVEEEKIENKEENSNGED